MASVSFIIDKGLGNSMWILRAQKHRVEYWNTYYPMDMFPIMAHAILAFCFLRTYARTPDDAISVATDENKDSIVERACYCAIDAIVSLCISALVGFTDIWYLFLVILSTLNTFLANGANYKAWFDFVSFVSLWAPILWQLHADNVSTVSVNPNPIDLSTLEAFVYGMLVLSGMQLVVDLLELSPQLIECLGRVCCSRKYAHDRERIISGILSSLVAGLYAMQVCILSWVIITTFTKSADDLDFQNECVCTCAT